MKLPPLLACALLCGPAPAALRPVPPTPQSPAAPEALAADAGLAAAVRSALSGEDPTFVRQVGASGASGASGEGVESGWSAPNRGGSLDVFAHQGGVELTPLGGGRDWHLGLSLAAIARGAERLELAAADVDAIDDRVEFRRPGSTEWYLNGEDGLEQVITLDERPLPRAPGALELEMSVSTALQPRLDADGRGLAFHDACAGEVVRYAGLSVFDASGRSLPAKFRLRDGAATIVVADEDALYPLTVDPLLQNTQTPLEPSGNVPFGYMGSAVDMHGSVAVIGAPGSGVHMGTAYILELVGLTWSVAAKLVDVGMTAGDRVGSAVAVYGNTVLVGAPYNDELGASAGRVIVLNRDAGGNWNKTQEIVGPNTDLADRFGSSISIGLRFGNPRVAVGAPGYFGSRGEVHVFSLSNGSLAHVQRLRLSDAEQGDGFGRSVDLDEARLVVGADNVDPGGRVYVYRHTGFVWDLDQVLDAPAGESGFGYSLGLEGDTLAVATHTGNVEFFEDAGANFAPDGTYDIGDDSTLIVDVVDDGNLRRAIVGAQYRSQAVILEKTAANWPSTGKQTLAIGSNTGFGAAVKLEGIYAFAGARQIGSAYAYRDIGSGYGLAGVFQHLNADPFEEFGTAVDVDGDTAVVGAAKDGDSAVAAGAAYVFERESGVWLQTAKLLPRSFGLRDGLFGRSVAVLGPVILVGAPNEALQDTTVRSGAVYVFRRAGSSTNWNLDRRLEPLDGDAFDQFGKSVDVNGNSHAVIGAPGDDDNGSAAGAVYVFEYTGGNQWPFKVKLTASDGSAGDQLGESVAVDRFTLVAGALLADEPSSASGAAYVFERQSTWTETQRLTPGDVTASKLFGRSVDLDIDAGWLIVGADGDGQNGSTAGAAYVFGTDGTSWTEEEKLLPQNGSSGDRFGYSVGISGGLAIVGARLADRDGRNDSGTAYLFRSSGGSWIEDDELTPPNAQDGALAGASVAIDQITAMVGVPRFDTSLEDSGRALVVVATPDPPVIYCTPKQTSCGNSPQISFIGTPSATKASGFEIRASGVPGEKFSLLIYTEDGRAAIPFQGGVLCLQPSVYRTFPFPSSGTKGQCNGSLSLDMNRFAAGQFGGNPQAFLRHPGTMVNCQYWGRDKPNYSMLTNAIEYVIGE